MHRRASLVPCPGPGTLPPAGPQLQPKCAHNSQESANSDAGLEFLSRLTVPSKLGFSKPALPQDSLSDTHFTTNFVCTTQFAQVRPENRKGKQVLRLSPQSRLSRTMPPSLGPQPQSRQLLQKGTMSPNGRSEHGAAARSLPSWRAERRARRCRYPPIAGSRAIAALRSGGWGGGPAAPRRDGLPRLPGLGHLPRTGAGAPKPCFREGQDGHLSERHVRRCSRSADAGPGTPVCAWSRGLF